MGWDWIGWDGMRREEMCTIDKRSLATYIHDAGRCRGEEALFHIQRKI